MNFGNIYVYSAADLVYPNTYSKDLLNLIQDIFETFNPYQKREVSSVKSLKYCRGRKKSTFEK